MRSERLLLHALVREGHPLPDASLRAVREGGIAAVAGVLEGPVEADLRQVRRHMDVIAGLFSSGTVVPFRFGALVQDEKELRRTLRRRAVFYSDLLRRLEGAGELLLKVAPLEKALLASVLREKPELRGLVRSTRAQGFGGQVALGQAVADEFEMALAEESRRVLAALAPLVREVKEGRPRAGALRASLLVDLIAVDRVRTAVAELQDGAGGKIELRLTGPLPPYSFVSGSEPDSSDEEARWAS